MRRVARKIRQAFFAEFGSIDAMNKQEIDLCIASMISLHMGELVECFARFGNPNMTLREQVDVALSAFIVGNADQITEIAGVGDDAAKRHYLTTAD